MNNTANRIIVLAFIIAGRVSASDQLRGSALVAQDPPGRNGRQLQLAEPAEVWVSDFNPDGYSIWRDFVLESAPAYYACGAEIATLEPIHDIACEDNSPNPPKWRGVKMCPHGSFVGGAQVKTSGSGGIISGLRILCERPTARSGAERIAAELWVTVPGESQSSLDNWQAQVRLGSDDKVAKFVKGAEVRYAAHTYGAARWNGFNFMVDEMHYGVSRAEVKGRWNLRLSGPVTEYSVTTSMEVSNGEEVTEEWSRGFYWEISGGFSFELGPIGGNTELTVGEEQAYSTAKSVQSTLSLTKTETFTVSCDGSSPTGRWFLWQWHMEQKGDAVGPGFLMESTHFDCTPDQFEPPRCPLGFCKDKMCLTCHYPFEHLSVTPAPSQTPTKSPTMAPTLQPSPSPTLATPEPSPSPTMSPTLQTPEPTLSPTIEITGVPTKSSTMAPTLQPSPSPTLATPEPAPSPTMSPTLQTPEPTLAQY